MLSMTSVCCFHSHCPLQLVHVRGSLQQREGNTQLENIYIHATANPLLTFYFDFHNEIGLGALLGHITTIVLTHIRDVLM